MTVNPLLLIEEIISGGAIMASAGHGLLVRYGLGKEPDAASQARWAAVVRQLVNSGMNRDVAGEAAARQVFPDFHTRVYASESDTIETLLRLAEDK